MRIRQMIAAFAGHEDKWAQITDRDGIARQAIYILHAYADRVPPVAGKSADQVFAEAFQAAADEIDRTDHIKIGYSGPLETGVPDGIAGWPKQAWSRLGEYGASS